MQAATSSVVTDLFFHNNFPTFVIHMDKSMETTIIRIGNSRGIIIPARVLKKIGLKEGARVKLEEKGDGTLSLSAVPEVEPYTGPFTGPFKALKDIVDPDAFGGRDLDPVEYVRQLRSDEGVEKRKLPWDE